MSGGERYLGLELGGSRRTALVTLDFFRKENKVFNIPSPHSHFAHMKNLNRKLRFLA